MSGKSNPGDHWRQTSVVIRSDIWLKAVEMGLDISDELNQRLAGRLGIEYRHEQLADRPLPESIVGAADSKVKKETESRPQTPILHPVINADDPAAATKVRKAKRQLPPEPVQVVPVPAASPQLETDLSPVQSVPKVSRKGEAKKGEPKRKSKDEVLKKFVTTRITRVDADDAIVSKDDMYDAFSRWCRDHRVTAVPERKVFATMLKNKFAIAEKNMSGTSCWVHVRLG